MSAFRLGDRIRIRSIIRDLQHLSSIGTQCLVTQMHEDDQLYALEIKDNGQRHYWCMNAFSPYEYELVSAAPPNSIHTHTLADELADVVAKHLGAPVTSGMRCLLLGVVQGHTGKVIEGPEQL